MAKTDPKANWQPAKVKKEIAPRSYLITDNNDRVLRRNRSHLMKVPEPSSTNAETRSTRTSGETRPASSEQEVQSERQTTQVEYSNLSEKAGLVTSRYLYQLCKCTSLPPTAAESSASHTCLTSGIFNLRRESLQLCQVTEYQGIARGSPCVVPSCDKISPPPHMKSLEGLLQVLIMYMDILLQVN
ncbi:Hypothetical predicted protein [Paramuricea clavata]|uniref:Uncharacterized protein n=1 Tax=Paramuricea clavata TaxID=317549 RepID=A0A7D9ICR4_PARCT|nr:Hypothetical predicted protein [Paramuricea clavata]